MKRLSNLFMIFIVMVLLSAMNFANEQDVTTLVNEYIKTAKAKEVKVVDKFLSDNADFIRINSIINKRNVHDKDDFLDLVKAGNFCNWSTETNVKIVDVKDNMAMATIEYANNKLIQTEYLTLVLNEGNWEIVNSVCSLSKK